MKIETLDAIKLEIEKLGNYGHAPFVALQEVIKKRSLNKSEIGILFNKLVPKDDYDLADRDSLVEHLYAVNNTI